MNSRAAAILLLPLLLVASGCGSSTPAHSGPLTVYPRPAHGMDALLEGTLRDVGGCVVVQLADDSLVVPVFPEGDAIWEDGVLTWKGEALDSGAAVRLGGGFAESDDADVPEGCGARPTFLVSP